MFTVPYLFAPPARQPSRSWACAVALLLAQASPGALAQQTLTLDRALQLAQQRSHQLVAQNAGAAAARALAVAAGQLPDPVLKAGLNSLPISGPDRFSLTRDSFTMASVGVVQEFTRADKRLARAARFEREAEIAEAGRAVALAQLRRDTATAWLDRLYQERLRTLLQAQRVEARLQIEAAEAAYRGGRGAQADVLAALAAVAQIDDRLLQAERQIATATTRLARWVGDDASQALGEPPDLAINRLEAMHLQTDWTHHPQIVLMARQQALASAEADIAQTNQRADWSFELTYSQRGAAYSNMVSMSVSVPLQWDPKNRQDRELSAKRALVQQLTAQREEAAREHVAQARAGLQEWHSNWGRLQHFDTALVPLAAARMHAALAAYRGGSGALGAVLEARRMEIDIRIDRLRLEMETAGLWAQLEYLIPAAHAAAAFTER